MPPAATMLPGVRHVPALEIAPPPLVSLPGAKRWCTLVDAGSLLTGRARRERRRAGPQEFDIGTSKSPSVDVPVGPGSRRELSGARSAERDGVAVESRARQRHVMHIVDTLDAGGKERVAVNLVNAVPRDRYRMSLCTTRRDGALSDLVSSDVGRVRIARTWRFDPSAIVKTVDFVRAQGVDLLHAHGSSLFHARLVARFAPYPRVIWHDHYGRCADEDRSVWMYRRATAGIAGVITVNSQLAEWARAALRVPADRVWYVPNFVVTDAVAQPLSDGLTLPGTPAARIVCVAHFRPQKDHLTLIAGMAIVAAAYPAAQLLLVGETLESDYLHAVHREIAARGLERHVTVLGLRKDVSAILRASAVGVLSSESEGLPLALIEYGNSGLAAVATDVGECAAVLDRGRAGVLVPPRDPRALGQALLSVLTSDERRRALSTRLKAHVEANFSQAQGVRRVCDIYDHILGGS